MLFHGTPRANLAVDHAGRAAAAAAGTTSTCRSTSPTALVVGRRRSADVVILEVAAGAMAEAGHVFHRSANGVWLTAVVPPSYLCANVRSKRTNRSPSREVGRAADRLAWGMGRVTRRQLTNLLGALGLRRASSAGLAFGLPAARPVRCPPSARSATDQPYRSAAG